MNICKVYWGDLLIRVKLQTVSMLRKIKEVISHMLNDFEVFGNECNEVNGRYWVNEGICNVNRYNRKCEHSVKFHDLKKKSFPFLSKYD